ncbi:hypothetical protein D3C74_465670 [compost metagenome]
MVWAYSEPAMNGTDSGKSPLHCSRADSMEGITPKSLENSSWVSVLVRCSTRSLAAFLFLLPEAMPQQFV